MDVKKEVSKEAEGPATGPKEKYNEWRSLRTHSAENMMTSYKELFFAGFPRRLVTGPDGKRYTDKSVTPFPQSFVYDFFQKYGVIENFAYDDERGIGSVTFADGEAGEGCYLCAHLSLVFPPVQMKSSSNDGSGKTLEGLKPILIILEFAQALAFVNPALLLHEELQSYDMSRHLLRTFPRVERKYASNSAESVVMEWVSEPVEEQGAETTKLKAVGPFFPGGDIEVPELRQSLWRVLHPPDMKPEVNRKITVLDLWFEYYLQFHIEKTTPAPERIGNPLFLFAQRQSVAQEIAVFDPSEPNESGRGVNIAHRLIHDDAFHQTCTLLCYSIKFKNDPTWASFMRDVFTNSVESAVKVNLAARSYTADRHLMNLQQSLLNTLHQNGSEEAWLALPLTTAALNAMENIKLLRRIELGEINRKSGEDFPPHEIRKIREKNKVGAAALEDPYIIFSDFANYVDNFATSGAATGLLSICEDPHTFRAAKGHTGYNAIFDTSSTFKMLWEIFWIPIVAMLALISIILVLNYAH